MSSIYLKSASGFPILDENGLPYVCEDCPCACPASYTVTFAGLSTSCGCVVAPREDIPTTDYNNTLDDGLPFDGSYVMPKGLLPVGSYLQYNASVFTFRSLGEFHPGFEDFDPCTLGQNGMSGTAEAILLCDPAIQLPVYLEIRLPNNPPEEGAAYRAVNATGLAIGSAIANGSCGDRDAWPASGDLESPRPILYSGGTATIAVTP